MEVKINLSVKFSQEAISKIIDLFSSVILFGRLHFLA